MLSKIRYALNQFRVARYTCKVLDLVRAELPNAQPWEIATLAQNINNRIVDCWIDGVPADVVAEVLVEAYEIYHTPHVRVNGVPVMVRF